ncbi:MAG TPA: tyrosine-protein phosphatase [Pyrinomonadaceae bacterium]
MKNIFRFHVVILAIVATLTTVSAQTDGKQFQHIKIKNFGQMDTNYFRGGQPKEDQYKDLAALGINTIVDLRNDPEDYEKPSAEALGMKYINIPMDDAEYPSEASINRFLEVINDPANGKMFVHCKGGKHRAGVTGAVYRFTKYGWNYDQAYAEMMKFKFNTSWGRKVMKTFVQDYAAKMANNAAAKDATGAGR